VVDPHQNVYVGDRGNRGTPATGTIYIAKLAGRVPGWKKWKRRGS